MLPANSHIQSANTSEINHDVQHTTSYYLITSRKKLILSRISVQLSTPVLKQDNSPQAYKCFCSGLLVHIKPLLTDYKAFSCHGCQSCASAWRVHAKNSVPSLNLLDP